MRRIGPWLVVSISTLFSGCMAFDAVAGSGKVVSEPRTVSGFSAVSMGGDGQLTLEQTGSESLTVTTDDNLLPYIRAEVKDGKLELGLKSGLTQVQPTNGVVFKLTVRSLESLAISGSGRAEAKSINGERLQISLSGSGEVFAQGTVDDVDLNISGSGEFDGTNLKARRAAVHVSGSGGGAVNASDTLDASVSGSGSVRYAGAPQVTQRVSGSGSVERMQ